MDRISMWWNEMLEKEIKEGQGTISNEHLMELEYLGDEINPRMELGYSGEGLNPHAQNIATMQIYIAQLELAKRHVNRKGEN